MSRKYFDFGRIKQRGKPGDVVSVSQDELISGYKSGELIPVYDTKTHQIIMIKRDGYYPPEQLERFMEIK